MVYSIGFPEELKRKFSTEKTGFQKVKDFMGGTKLAFCINGQLIGDWFNRQYDKLRRHIHTYCSRNGKAGVFKIKKYRVALYYSY